MSMWLAAYLGITAVVAMGGLFFIGKGMATDNEPLGLGGLAVALSSIAWPVFIPILLGFAVAKRGRK